GDARLTREAMGSCEILAKLHVVEDGEKAISFLRREAEYAEAKRPDLILLDLNLPRMDGRDVLTRVKSSKTLCHIPIVILTTSQSPADISHAYDLHANCFVTKPIDLDGFTDTVQSIVRFWLHTVELPPEDR
ncbi:MAG: response regulator, partial [Propionibacteriaceae bacterium]|nr:response regulator [Propionibacteriaceae bacterium]